MSNGTVPVLKAGILLIIEHYGYRQFDRSGDWLRVNLGSIVAPGSQTRKPSVLHDVTTAPLIERKRLLPGPSVLARRVQLVA